MATKKFIIEVEEGWTKCDKDCPFAGAAFLGYQCGLHNEIGFGELQCTKYNLATMKIKELEENNESKS